jgi:fructose-specific phosphotransferase system IIC component
MNPQEAQAALAAVQQSRSDMADRLITPWWYHPVLGVLVGGLITVATVGVPFQTLLGVIAVYGAGLAFLVTAYRRKARVWASGWDGGPKSRRTLTLLFAVVLVTTVVGAMASMGLEIRWAAPITGLVVAVFMTVWGRHFDKVMRAELRETS